MISITNVLIVLSFALSIQMIIESYLHRGTKYQGSHNSKYYKHDYYSARAFFRSQMRQLKHAELHSIPMDIQDYDLTIDVGIIRRSKEKMLVHISGTHGVEGFAGSAIQNALLEKSNITRDDPSLPTLVIVHVLNPFGMASLRRWNENNVDLNRNFLSEKKFEEKMSMDPNKYGYEDLYDLINPSQLDWTDFFWVKVVYYITMYGYTPIKQSLVTGNYHHPKSLFYGGKNLQPSHMKISTFLRGRFDLSQVKELAVLDIHTGLGASGHDALMATQQLGFNEPEEIFGKSTNEHILCSNNDRAFSGYQFVEGDVPQGITGLFPSLNKAAPFTLEFGTVPGILVFKALRAEGAAFHHDIANRVLEAQNVRDAFYLNRNPHWLNAIVDRGIVVSELLFKWLASKESDSNV